MRIVRIANVDDNRTGGISRTMYLTGDELERRGHTVLYRFAPSFDLRSPSRLHRFVSPGRAAELAIDANRQHGVDLVEMHEPLAFRYAAQRRHDPSLPPVVAFSHGLESRGRAAWLDYHESQGLPVSMVSRVTTGIVVRRSNLGLRAADLVVCCNDTDAEQARSTRGTKDGVTLHFPGVQQELCEAPVSQDDSRFERLLFLGTWIQRKGTIELEQAIETIARRRPSCRFTIAGVGNRAPVVEQWIERAGLSRSVAVVPNVDGVAELLALLSEHGVFLLPSYFEGYPVSLIEAASLGLAPIVSDIGAHRAFVRHEENGLLTRVGSAEGLTAAIERLIGDVSLANRLAHRACEMARRQTWEASAANLEDAYLRLLGRSAAVLPQTVGAS